MDNSGRARQRVLALFLPIAALLYISAELFGEAGAWRAGWQSYSL